MRGRLSNAANVREVDVSAAPNGPAGMWLLPQHVDLQAVDLFHAPSNILPHGLTMPCVTTIHDVMWLTQPHLCNPGLWGYVERHFYSHGMRRALRKSAAIITVSEATRSAVLQIAPKLADRTFAVRSGVSADFAPQGAGAGTIGKHKLPARPYILVVGQSAPYKNHGGAIRGFAAAFADRQDIDLVIVQRRGKAQHRLAADCGIGARTHFIQVSTGDDLAMLYRGAIALLHPSLCEGFGMPLAEAMASGCPVITSNRPAPVEVTGGAALLIEPDDPQSIAVALKRIADEPELRQTLRQRGLARARQLDWRQAAAATIRIYREVLSMK